MVSLDKIENKDLIELQGQDNEEEKAEFQSIKDNFEKQNGPIVNEKGEPLSTDMAFQLFVKLKGGQEYQSEGRMTKNDQKIDQVALIHRVEDALRKIGGWQELKSSKSGNDNTIKLNLETDDSIEVQARFIYNQRDTDEKRIEYSEKL